MSDAKLFFIWFILIFELLIGAAAVVVVVCLKICLYFSLVKQVMAMQTCGYLKEILAGSQFYPVTNFS